MFVIVFIKMYTNYVALLWKPLTDLATKFIYNFKISFVYHGLTVIVIIEIIIIIKYYNVKWFNILSEDLELPT